MTQAPEYETKEDFIVPVQSVWRSKVDDYVWKVKFSKGRLICINNSEKDFWTCKKLFQEFYYCIKI